VRKASRVELEAVDELFPAGAVEPAVQAAEQVDALPAAQPRPQRGVAGHVGETGVDVDGVATRVQSEDRDPSGVQTQLTEQGADGGRLAGPVGAEEPVDLAGPDGQVEAGERMSAAERLGQGLSADDKF